MRRPRSSSDTAVGVLVLLLLFFVAYCVGFTLYHFVDWFVKIT